MRKTFTGLCAWLGTIDSAYRCEVWTQEPTGVEFDPKLLIPIDLGRCPLAVGNRQYTWAQVSVQDFGKPDEHGVTLGKTTIGPSFPTPYVNGALYVENDTLAALRQQFDIPEPTLYFAGRDYEFLTVLEIDDSGPPPQPTVTFHGAYAEILADGVTVQVFQRCRSLETNPVPIAGTFPVADLADPTKVHPDLTVVGKGGVTAGAVYLENSYALGVGLADPKRPLWLG